MRLANEILRARQRADAIAAQEAARRLNQRPEAIDRRVVDTLVGNVVRIICAYVDPRDAPGALDELRALQASYAPGTRAQVHPPPKDMSGDLEDALPTPNSRASLGKHVPDQAPIDRLPADGQPEGEAEQTGFQAPLDDPPGGGGGQATSPVGEIDAMPGPIDDPTVAADPGRQCGTCANMESNWWCHRQRFFVTPTVPACGVYYEPVSAAPSRQ